MGRSYRNYDTTSNRDKLFDTCWDDFSKLEDPDLTWDFILGKIIGALDSLCPLQTFRIKNYRPDWMTDELIEQIKDRDYFYRKAKSKGNPDDWNIAKYLRNITNANIRGAKREYVLDKLERYDTDAKKFWKTIQEVVPPNKSNSKQDILLRDKGTKIDRDGVAHFINEFFINVGKVGKEIQPPPPPRVTDQAAPDSLTEPPPVVDFTPIRVREV